MPTALTETPDQLSHNYRPQTSRSVTRSARRYTPYGRTPRSRRLVNNLGTKSVHQDKRKGPSRRSGIARNEEEIVNLNGLTYKTWKVFKVTPLYNFGSSPRDLKRYGALLSAHVDAEREKGVFVDNTISGKAVFSWYGGIKSTSVDKEALQILIRGKPKRGNGQDVVVLTAILCSVGLQEPSVKKDVESSFTYYPLLLVKSTVAFNDALISWLQSWFDCKICPLQLSPAELAWMVAIWSGSVTESARKSKPVELFYTVPAECTGISKITYTIDPNDCLQLWKSIHDSDREEFTSDEVSMFIKSLEHHFYRVFKVKLSAMCLSRIGTSLAYLGSDGRLKIFSGDHALRILHHLTELAVEWFNGII